MLQGGIQTLTDSRNVMKSKPKMECWNALPHCVASTVVVSEIAINFRYAVGIHSTMPLSYPE